MSLERLKAARTFCIGKFGSFYGARHLLILTVLGSLSQSTDYASFHKANKITYKHYLTQEQEDLLNNAFQLPISFTNQVICE